MSKPIESVIECPFYIKENKYCIFCEGIIKNTIAQQIFRTDYEKNNYEVYVCSENNGANCPHNQMLMTLYEEGARNGEYIR